MPEGDTIFRAARTLNRALAGKIVTKFETQLPQLSRVDYDTPLTGRVIESVQSSGKWMSIHFSGDLTLLTHMLMSGSWHIYRPGEKWQRPRQQMRVVIHTEDFVAVAFQIQVAEFHTAASLLRQRSLRRLGPDVLAPEFDETTAASNLRARPEVEVGVALLNQQILAGLGNVFKSEICFASGVNPFSPVSSLTNQEVQALISNSRMLLTIGAQAGDRPTAVYRRSGEACKKCGTAVRSQKQGLDARITFWCPTCQPLHAASAAFPGGESP